MKNILKFTIFPTSQVASKHPELKSHNRTCNKCKLCILIAHKQTNAITQVKVYPLLNPHFQIIGNLEDNLKDIQKPDKRQSCQI